MKNTDGYDFPAGVWWGILIIAFLSLFFGCSRKVYVPVEHKTVETVTLRDTVVQMRLEVIRDSVAVPDTLSYLENKYAESWAEWKSGRLHHSLGTKQTQVPVQVQYVEKERVVEVPKPYPVEVVKFVEKELSWWQKLTMWLGNIAIIGAGVWGIFGFGRRK